MPKPTKMFLPTR